MMCEYEIWHDGVLIARAPADTHLDLTLADGRKLHVGPLGMFFKTEVTSQDGVILKGVYE